MVKSMTGYGRARQMRSGRDITVEVRSVNNRYLDCTVKMPRAYIFAEDAIKSRVQKAVSRGKVDVFITIDATGADETVVTVNEALARGYYDALMRLKDTFGLEGRVTPDMLAKFPDVLTVTKAEEDVDAIAADICAVLDAEVPSTSTLQTDLLSESDLTDAFTQEGAADTLRGLAYGQAAAIQYTGYAMMLAVRLDPLSISTLDALRSQILSDMKGEELNDALAAYGMLHADGTPQLDANTGTQAAFDNLLILYSGSSLRDDGRTLDYDLSMGGGVWLNGGHLWQVTWTQGTQSTLALYDSNGKPLNLPAGRSYIALLSSLTGQELLVQSSTGEALVGAG
mgnify:CR=1 FL=1